MLSNEQIQEQIQKEYQDYLNKPFSDTLPDWFIPKFGDAIMSVPMGSVENRAETLTSIFSKRAEELTTFEVGVMIKIFMATQPNAISKDVRKYVPMKKILEGIMAQWGMAVTKEEHRLQRKTASMSAENRSRIVPANAIGSNELRAK